MPQTGEPGRSNKPRRRPLALTALLIALIALSVGAWVLTRPHSVLEHAVRITGFTNYAWINTDEMVVFDHNGAGDLRAQRIHLRTHAQSYIDAFNTFSAQYHWHNCANAVVGPDQRLLFVYVKDENGQASVLTSTDGSEALVLRGSEYPVMLPDGQRWLALAWSDSDSFNMNGNEPKKLWLYSDNSRGRRVGPLPLAARAQTLLGVTPDYRVIATDQPRGVDEPMLTVFQRGIYPNTLPERTASLAAPVGWFIRSAALNSKGDRIACLFTTVRREPFAEMVSRVIPGLIKTKASRVYLLRACRPDSSGSRDIGFVDTQSPDGTVTQLQWTPDGKHLSFFYRDAITIVPAE